MTQENAQCFIQWLDKQLADNRLNDHQLAQKAGISHSVISKARKGILPKWDACVSIARALNVDPIQIFRIAGLLQNPPELDPNFEALKFSYGKLSPKFQKIVIRIIQMLSEETSD